MGGFKKLAEAGAEVLKDRLAGIPQSPQEIEAAAFRRALEGSGPPGSVTVGVDLAVPGGEMTAVVVQHQVDDKLETAETLRIIPTSVHRPTFVAIYMGLAVMMSKRSTCRRLNVGCAIVTPDFRKVLAVGYNGNVSGGANDCDSNTVGSCGCLHGEENAAINCDVPRATEKIVICTHLPCLMCAKRLVNLGGVKQVFYWKDYRKREALELLKAAGIDVQQQDHNTLVTS